MCSLRRTSRSPNIETPLKFVDHAQRVDDHAIGWLPTLAIQTYIDREGFTDVQINDDRVAYALHRVDRLGRGQIIQTWVRPDARLIENGKELIRRVETKLAEKNVHELRLWCASDLPANIFWSALQFEPIAWDFGKRKSGRRRVLWRRPLLQITRPILSQSPYAASTHTTRSIQPTNP